MIVMAATAALLAGAQARADQYNTLPAQGTTQGKVICVPNEKQPVAGHDETMACGPVRVHFDTDSADLGEDAKAILSVTARCLQEHPNARFSVVGGADQRGGEDYNRTLGEKRAQSVSSFLESQGVASGRLQSQSIGKDRPLCTEDTPECLARNRRAAVMPSTGALAPGEKEPAPAERIPE